MIEITNKTAEFFEEKSGEILIYGAGNSGYWIGNYMNKCGISFSGYLDRKISVEGTIMNKKPIYRPNWLSQYKDRSIRIVVSPRLYESVISDLVFAEKQYGFHALCLVPKYMHFIHRKEMYHINKLLGYFRRKLYEGDIPTIISNDCVAGEIYDMMDMLMLSPTINVNINEADYLKLCRNPNKYLSVEAENLFHQRIQFGQQNIESEPAISINDITIGFGHADADTETRIMERWNMMRKRINQNEMIFIFRANKTPVSGRFIKEFSRMQDKHLLIVIGNAGIIYHDVDYLLLNENYFCRTDRAIENYFDLLGWMNEIKKI